MRFKQVVIEYSFQYSVTRMDLSLPRGWTTADKSLSCHLRKYSFSLVFVTNLSNRSEYSHRKDNKAFYVCLKICSFRDFIVWQHQNHNFLRPLTDSLSSYVLFASPKFLTHDWQSDNNSLSKKEKRLDFFEKLWYNETYCIIATHKQRSFCLFEIVQIFEGGAGYGKMYVLRKGCYVWQ